MCGEKAPFLELKYEYLNYCVTITYDIIAPTFIKNTLTARSGLSSGICLGNSALLICGQFGLKCS